MRPTFLGCVLLMLATDAWAHRLDEYLHAIRISVALNRIDFSFELTPGVAVAEDVLLKIDTDRDGQVSEKEAGAYTHRVLKDIRIELDKKVLALRVVKTSFPSLREVRAGLGVIRIKATTQAAKSAAAKHVLTLTDDHQPEISVYLVNALVPKDEAIEIIQQTRDERQKEYRLEFQVNLTQQ